MPKKKERERERHREKKRIITNPHKINKTYIGGSYISIYI